MGEINAFAKRVVDSWYVSPVAGEQNKILKAAAGELQFLRITNTTNAARYAHVYDNATGAGGTPLCPPLVIAANGEQTLQQRFRVAFANGCYIASSASQTSVTGGGSNDLQIQALYH